MLRRAILVLLVLLVMIMLGAGKQPVTAQDMGPTAAPTIPPGQPVLVIRNYTVSPDTTVPGGRVSLTLEVANVGTRIAQGISVSVDAGDKVIPAAGQSSVTLPDMARYLSSRVHGRDNCQKRYTRPDQPANQHLVL
jgi:hypothetical protein